MTKFLLPALLTASILQAQEPFCHTTERQNDWFAQHPELKAEFEKLQEEAAATDREMFKYGYAQPQQAFAKSAAASTYTIPVVFHILHTGGPENLSDAQVKNAVDILTTDFSKLNADTSDVVSAFKNSIGNPEIAFVLATRDPNGNCTNGIVRHYDTDTDWKGSFSDYKYSWPRQRYLNIYVVRTIQSGAAGYTYLPGSGIPAAADAIVILSSYVGSIGTGNPGRARALTHEVGHWLNLPHTWGGTNQPGVACGDEGVSDTPVTKGFTSCNLSKAAVCNVGVEENMQNYMDYAYCQRMFTKGQAARMQVAINSSIAGRNNLSASGNLALTGISNPLSGCAPAIDIAVDGGTVCAGKSLGVNSYTSVGEATSYSWSASGGATFQNSTAAKTTVNFINAGTATIYCVASNTAGSSTASTVVHVKAPWAEISTAHMESFEYSAPALPMHWTKQSTAGAGWQTNNIGASQGMTSMYVAGEQLPKNVVSILETPSYNFKDNGGALFTFKYAYRRESSATKDLFVVQASSDCGGTWQDIYAPSPAVMAQGSGGVGTTPLEPDPSEWKLYTQLVNHPLFMPFKQEPNVRFRFYFKTDVDGTGYANRFFLDEINFDIPVGVNELTKHFSFNVYPNPANAQANIAFTLPEPANVSYKVISVSGAEVTGETVTRYSAGEHNIAVNAQRTFAPGIYFVNVEINGTTMSRKLIIR